ncbi:MAG: hypothetical protein QOE19_454 [Actinomycetota bacterium]|jgi:transcriptional regulator with GAF, ATPase, and Fis domain|nr:hypothetical protein [Actinomycetota bacterium]
MPDDGPAGHDEVHALIERFTVAASRMHATEDFEESLKRITDTAVQALRGCEAASISLLERDRPVTRGATAALALAADQIQYEEGEGPCLDAALQERWVYTPDLTHEPRWPRSAGRMSQLGVGSMFSLRLTLDASPHTLGGLNLYATTPKAFDEHDQLLGILLASVGAVVVDGARQQEHLRAAIASRQVIGEAVGLLRAEAKLSSQQAFEALSRASQRTNVKLRDLAQRISDGAEGGTDASPVAVGE